MENFFKSLDLWGTNFTFLINKKSRFTSIYGGITTMMFLLGSFIYISYNIYNLLNYDLATTTSDTSLLIRPQINFIEYPKFMFAFCVGDQFNSTKRDPFITKTLNVTLSWHHLTRQPWLISGDIPIKMKTCTFDMFPAKTVNKYTFKLFSDCQCVTNDDLKIYNLSNVYTDSYMSNLRISAKFKDKIYDNTTLYESTYKYYVKSTPKSYLYFIDNVVNISSILNPFENYLNFNTQMLNVDLFTTSELYFNILDVKIDDFILGSSKIKY